MRALVNRTSEDFIAYFSGSAFAGRALEIVAAAVSADPQLARFEEDLDSILPDTESDGSWSASYALNTGCMILSLIQTPRRDCRVSHEEAISLFFDTVDFKVQEAMIGAGTSNPSELQIAEHPIMKREKQWFAALAT